MYFRTINRFDEKEIRSYFCFLFRILLAQFQSVWSSTVFWRVFSLFVFGEISRAPEVDLRAMFQKSKRISLDKVISNAISSTLATRVNLLLSTRPILLSANLFLSNQILSEQINFEKNLNIFKEKPPLGKWPWMNDTHYIYSRKALANFFVNVYFEQLSDSR